MYTNKRINKILKEKYEYKNQLFPAIFFDRDGVLIKECHYIDDPKKVVLETGSYELVKTAFNFNWILVIITNQSGISKGHLTWEKYNLITNKMISLFENLNPFAGIYANSLTKVSEDLSWRKPSPGMLYQAARDLPIDLHKSILIGDRITDIKAGQSAKLSKVFHVLSGHGIRERAAILNELKSNRDYNKLKSSTSINLIDSLSNFPIDLIKENGF